MKIIFSHKTAIENVIGNHMRTTVFELRECGLVPLRLTLPREYRVHACQVHKEKIWVCGTRDNPHSCDSFDEEWNHTSEKDTMYPHSYGSMASSYRGLVILGKFEHQIRTYSYGLPA